MCIIDHNKWDKNSYQQKNMLVKVSAIIYERTIIKSLMVITGLDKFISTRAF